MSNELDVMAGIAELLDSTSVADFRADGAYQDTDTALVFNVMPAAPDRCVCITVYTYANAPDFGLDQIRVQIRCRGARGNYSDANDLHTAAYEVLHGLVNMDFGAVHIIQLLQQSSIPMGVDDSQRFEISDNYVADVDVPATTNRPA